jgi:hypothetical protein
MKKLYLSIFLILLLGVPTLSISAVTPTGAYVAEVDYVWNLKVYDLQKLLKSVDNIIASLPTALVHVIDVSNDETEEIVRHYGTLKLIFYYVTPIDLQAFISLLGSVLLLETETYYAPCRMTLSITDSGVEP